MLITISQSELEVSPLSVTKSLLLLIRRNGVSLVITEDNGAWKDAYTDNTSADFARIYVDGCRNLA